MSASLFAQAMREFFHHHAAWPASYYEDRLAKVYGKILEPGDCAVDVGAHSGFHATRILDCIGPSGHLICVEPLPEIFRQLKESLEGRSVNVTFFNGVLSNENSSNTSFQRAVGLPGESGLKKRVRYGLPGTKTETLSVQSKQLDDIVSGHDAIKYIKIDTEGAELTILSSGQRTMRDLRPVISVEWGSDTYIPYGHEARDLFAFARGRGYSVFDLFTNMVGSEREWLEVTDRGSWDYILVPDEKVAWFIYAQNS